LLKKGIYVTRKEAERDYIEKNRKINFRYVYQPFDAISDSSISATDAEIDAYYDEHNGEKEFQQEETTRSIEYVTFDVTPTEQDIEMIREELDELKKEFEETTEDTFFVNQNSDVPEDFMEVSEPGKSFPSEVDSLIFSADSGTVIGPFKDGEMYKLVKITGFRMYPDSVKARHILVRINNGDTASAKTKADSILSIVKRQHNFEDLAMRFSEDFQSAQDSGNLGWFKPGTMVPEFNEACFEGEVGEYQMIQTQFGFHIIQVTERAEPSRRIALAVIENKIEPGKLTRDRIYNTASAFSINNDTPEKFKQAGNENGIMVANYIKEGDKTIAGLDNPRELVRWAYKAEIGDISEPFEFADKYVVAHLTEIKEKGTLPLEDKDVQERCRVGVVKDKKAAKFIKKMSGFKTLDELARNLETEAKQVEQFTYSSFSVTGLGPEHTLIGKVFSTQQGAMSEPFRGKEGVFVIQVDQITEPDANPDLAASQKQLQQMQAGTVDYKVYNALLKAANIEDNRGKFY
ncbi:MAG: peptidylprolyl isomerase, partial [Flavobacteriales bacterium]